MIIGVGIDIIEISRIKEAVVKNEAFINKMFSDKEIELFKSKNYRYEVIAGNFAAKEAIVKAMGTGFSNIGYKDVEILRDMMGKPYVELYNNARKIVAESCIIHISISHCREYAVANAIIESCDYKGTHILDNMMTYIEDK